MTYPLSASQAQTDSVGSGRAIVLDGIDDQIVIGDYYHDLNFPFTISAWVFIDPNYDLAMPIFTTNLNDLDYHGVWFIVASTAIEVEIGDGFGGSFPAFRQGKLALLTISKGAWVHVSAVMRSIADIDLYVNGVDVGGFASGASNGPMQQSKPGDLARIGYWVSNTTTYRFKGAIDEVRIWNRSLSPTEIRQTMCSKLTGTEPNLIGYWTFDETSGDTVFDKSPNQFHGTLVGNPTRVFSGAPIGDVSTFLYPASWSGNSISLLDGVHSLNVFNVINSPPGVHLYEVKNLPSQTIGLDLAQTSQPYFGVFVAAVSGGGFFDLDYKKNGLAPCLMEGRKDNSVSTWVDKNPSNIQDRVEFIGIVPASGFTLDLGADKIFCDQSTYTISTGLDPAGKSFKWSTGETTPAITVSHSGNYFVEATAGCAKELDTLVVSLLSSPPQGSFLGEDEIVCKLEPKSLKPLIQPAGFVFTWQDGSHGDHYVVTKPGKYWVRIENYCGMMADTVEFSKYEIDWRKVPNVITPNNDPYNQYFKVEDGLLGSYLAIYNRWGQEIFKTDNYLNNWDGKGMDSGVYYYLIRDRCLKEFKGYVAIVR